MKIRVGVFTRPIDQGTSGSGSHLREIVSRLITADPEVDIILLHYQSRPDIALYSQQEEVVLPRNPLFAARVLKKANLDIIHYNPLTIYSPLVPGIKKVATIHGAAPLFLPQQVSKIRYCHEKWIVSRYARKMDGILSVSQKTKSFLIDRFGVKENRIQVIYNAVDTDFRPYGSSPIKTDNQKNNRPYIFHLSKFSHRKNPWTILKTLKEIKDRGLPHKLVIGGAKWNNPEVVKFINENKLESSVHIAGFLTKTQIIHHMNQASVFLFPSYYEGFGMPNLEAMACGCPVITSQAFAIPEIVSSGALLLKDPDNYLQAADYIQKLATDNNFKQELIQKGLQRAQQFSWDESVSSIIGLYKSLIQRS